jgi:hypothetical protein
MYRIRYQEDRKRKTGRYEEYPHRYSESNHGKHKRQKHNPPREPQGGEHKKVMTSVSPEPQRGDLHPFRGLRPHEKTPEPLVVQSEALHSPYI